MLLLFCVVIVAGAIGWYVISDMNTPFNEKLSTHVKKVEDKVESVADLNKDGVVSIADAKVAVEKTKKVTAKATAKVVDKVKKPRGRKKKTD